MRRRIAIVLLVSATAHAETRPQQGARATASLTSAPRSFDPVEAQSYAEVTLAGLIFDGLYRLDAKGAPVAHLAAADPVFAADGLSARVRVRKGVTFHDGTALGPADVVASLQRAGKSALAGWALAGVAKIEAATGETNEVVFTLRHATPELATLLALPQLAVTPGGKAPGKTPVGSGPYRVSKLGASRVDLDAAALHFAGRPHLDALVLRWFAKPGDEARAYEAGDADASLRGAVAFAGHDPKYPTASVDGPATVLVYLGFGKAHASLDADSSFRKAVSLALDRGAFKVITTGERVLPAVLPESPDLGGQAPSASETQARVAEAAKALALAAGGDAPPALELVYDKTRLDDEEVAKKVISALDSFGLDVSFTGLDGKEYAKRVAAGQCDLYVGQLVAPLATAAHEYAAAFAAGGDRWPETTVAAGTLELSAARAAFATRIPVVPLYHRAVRAHHKKTLYGLVFDALGRLDWPGAHVFEKP